MMRKYLILVLLIHVDPGRSQFGDFFPSFSIFSYTTPRTARVSVRPKPETHYRSDDNKPNNRRDDYNKDTKSMTDRIVYYTEKPLRKTTKRNRIRNFNTDDSTNENLYKNKNNEINDVREQRNYLDTYDDTNNHNYKTTHNYYELTTKNPFFDIPGVKPSIIDNRPPITNRPVYKTTTVRTTPRRPYVVPPRPTDSGALTFPDDDVIPEVLSGPDEDSMSEVEKERYVELAEKKCDIYKSFHTKQLQAIPLLPSPEPVEVNISSCAPTNIPLIVGGKVVSIGDFPHMALLGWPDTKEGGYSWKCGGSLISDQYVLTAGHCTYLERDEVTGPPRVVQLGSSYLDDPGALVVRVGSVIRHPKYKPNRSYYDVALLKLSSSVKFSELIRPACLGVPPHAGRHIIVTGWGQTQLVGNLSLELRSVSLPIWDIDSCTRVLGTSRKMPNGPSSDSQMCAGEPEGGKDTCQGDSGGPAQIQEGCIWRVVAVTSIGRSCAAPNTPGLYSLIHIPFVAAQVFDQNTGRNNYNTQNNQNNYNTHNNNNNYNTNNEQNYTQNSQNFDTQNENTNNYYNTQHRPNTQEKYNTHNNNHELNNQRYNNNGNGQSNLRKDRGNENNNGNINQESPRNNNNRFNSNDDQGNRNSQYTSEINDYNNYYRNEQNSRTENNNNNQRQNDDRSHETYDGYEKPVWWT